MEINYKKVTNSITVIILIKFRNMIENTIRKIDKMALVNYEIEALSQEK